MKLLVDIGNSRCKFALSDGQSVRSAFTLDNREVSEEILNSHCSESLQPGSAWISSVGPEQVFTTIDLWISRRFNLIASRVRVSDKSCGISNGYHDLEKLGVDRWIAAIGARSVEQNLDVLVIDVGTAITIDWLSHNNVFEGGVILPGYDLMHRALVGNTEGIESNMRHTSRIIGKTTTECVNSGISYGLVGAVERIVREMQQQIKKQCRVIITGGGADALSGKLNIDCHAEPRLVLLGLARIAQRAE